MDAELILVVVLALLLSKEEEEEAEPVANAISKTIIKRNFFIRNTFCLVLQSLDHYRNKEAWTAMPRLSEQVVGIPI